MTHEAFLPETFTHFDVLIEFLSELVAHFEALQYLSDVRRGKLVKMLCERVFNTVNQL